MYCQTPFRPVRSLSNSHRSWWQVAHALTNLTSFFEHFSPQNHPLTSCFLNNLGPRNSSFSGHLRDKLKSTFVGRTSQRQTLVPWANQEKIYIYRMQKPGWDTLGFEISKHRTRLTLCSRLCSLYMTEGRKWTTAGQIMDSIEWKHTHTLTKSSSLCFLSLQFSIWTESSKLIIVVCYNRKWHPYFGVEPKVFWVEQEPHCVWSRNYLLLKQTMLLG